MTDQSAPHPEYGPCDAFGRDGACSECTGVVARSTPAQAARGEEDRNEYQPRTPERLIEILTARDPNPRSWQSEAATTITRLTTELEEARDALREIANKAHYPDEGIARRALASAEQKP